MKQNGRAFTLIELLIVVAIIAILAAIAVPNFLEAQVRSKVARAKADMRSIATAVEAYTVDYNRPPLGYRWEISTEYTQVTGIDNNGNVPSSAHARFRASMTTPVAYISEWPKDAFAEGGTIRQIPENETYLAAIISPWYRYEDYMCTWWNSATVRGMGYTWATGSPGPTRYNYINLGRALSGVINHSSQPGLKYYPYDPTNGTISMGLIIRTNKGFWEEYGK